MQPGALHPYERALLTREPLHLQDSSGVVERLDVARWLGPADAVDSTVLDQCRGAVLDVGCGPGRLVAALTLRGQRALGIDIAAGAVAHARGLGVAALQRDVFSRVPAEGRWNTVLLIDGNIGIGGEPGTLLRRCSAVLAPGGRIIVETHADPRAEDRFAARFCRDGAPVGPSFLWARLGSLALERVAADAGLARTQAWTSGGRSFAVLEPDHS